MHIDRRTIAIVLVLPLLAACETTFRDMEGELAEFGEPNRQTMAAQVVDPDPVYTDPLPTSAEHAGQAADRYRDGTVKQPVRTATTSGPN